MSREKQIEEMADDIRRIRESYFGQADYLFAMKMYEDGYRKQSEGCDFCKVGSEKCGTCVKFFDYYEDGGSDRCSSEYGNEKCAYYKPVHHCSNCGARMSGGQNE